MRPIHKNFLTIPLGAISLAILSSSYSAYADIYKWRDNRGVVQYSDKPPVAGFTKVNRHELVNALQSKDLCAEPTAKTAAAATTKNIDANFFGFANPASNNGIMGQPAKAANPFGMGGFNSFGRNTSAAKPVSAPPRGISFTNNAPRSLPFAFGPAPRNTAQGFGGFNQTGFFNSGGKFVTVFGRPIIVAAAKPPATAPAPVPKPIPTPLPAATPLPTTGNPNIVQSGLMPAVDISKNMAPVIGASEPFIGKYNPPAPGDGDGQFRTACRPSHMSNDDPIIYPNQKGAAHHHTFFGNISVNYKSDVNNVRNAGTSTCKGGTANLSAYWVPSMIDTATKTPLVPNDAVFYYKTGYTVKRALVTAPPKGLRIIAGNSKSTVSQRENQYTNHVRYKCVLPGNINQPESDSIPACSQGSEIHSVVNFPNCWDGKNLDSPDHKSHMAYAKYGVGCPATHPTAIPTITYNIFYKVTQAAGTANWRLASDNYAKNGYNAGYSGHADWVNGWDANIIKIAVENCDNKGLDCGVGNLGNGTGLWFKKNSEY